MMVISRAARKVAIQSANIVNAVVDALMEFWGLGGSGVVFAVFSTSESGICDAGSRPKASERAILRETIT